MRWRTKGGWIVIAGAATAPMGSTAGPISARVWRSRRTRPDSWSISFDVSRSAWIGDYLDPTTFLDMWVTDGENNRTGWGHPRYDELIALAAREADLAKRLEHLQAAEALLMEELPILPVYFYVTKNMVNPRLGGFYENMLDEHYPKFWYWMDDAELEARRGARTDEWTRVEASGPSGGLYSPAELRRRAEAPR